MTAPTTGDEGGKAEGCGKAAFDREKVRDGEESEEGEREVQCFCLKIRSLPTPARGTGGNEGMEGSAGDAAVQAR